MGMGGQRIGLVSLEMLWQTWREGDGWTQASPIWAGPSWCRRQNPKVSGERPDYDRMATMGVQINMEGPAHGFWRMDGATANS